MKSLYKVLEPLILEAQGDSFEQALGKVNFLDELTTIETISKKDYVSTIMNRLKSKIKDKKGFKELVEKLYDKWVELSDDNASEKDPLKVPFRLQNSDKSVKVGRDYWDIIGAPSEKGNFSVSPKVYGIRIEMGTGSIKSLNAAIPTADQETATCLVWNALAKLNGSNEEMVELSPEQISKIALALNPKFPKVWLNSFGYQVHALYKFLKSFGVSNPADYRAARYGEVITNMYEDGTKYQYTTGKVYAEVVDSYVKRCAKEGFEDEGSKIEILNYMWQKDNYDPSDIVLFKLDDADAINGELKSLMSELTPNDLHKAFIEKFYRPRRLFGISLKQVGKNAHVEEYNTPDTKVQINVDDVSKKVSGTGNSIVLTCTGSFKLKGVGNEEVVENPKTIVLELRSFGDYWGMDCKELIGGKRGISLGKVPVNVVKEALKISSAKKESLHEAIKLLEEFDNLNVISQFIAAGIKNGPWCLPFILIH